MNDYTKNVDFSKYSGAQLAGAQAGAKAGAIAGHKSGSAAGAKAAVLSNQNPNISTNQAAKLGIDSGADAGARAGALAGAEAGAQSSIGATPEDAVKNGASAGEKAGISAGEKAGEVAGIEAITSPQTNSVLDLLPTRTDPIHIRHTRKTIALLITYLFIAVVIIQIALLFAYGEGIYSKIQIIRPELVEYVVVSVIAYYFGKSTALDKPGIDQDDSNK